MVMNADSARVCAASASASATLTRPRQSDGMDPTVRCTYPPTGTRTTSASVAHAGVSVSSVAAEHGAEYALAAEPLPQRRDDRGAADQQESVSQRRLSAPDAVTSAPMQLEELSDSYPAQPRHADASPAATDSQQMSGLSARQPAVLMHARARHASPRSLKRPGDYAEVQQAAAQQRALPKRPLAFDLSAKLRAGGAPKAASADGSSRAGDAALALMSTQDRFVPAPSSMPCCLRSDLNGPYDWARVQPRALLPLAPLRTVRSRAGSASQVSKLLPDLIADGDDDAPGTEDLRWLEQASGLLAPRADAVAPALAYAAPSLPHSAPHIASAPAHSDPVAQPLPRANSDTAALSFGAQDDTLMSMLAGPQRANAAYPSDQPRLTSDCARTRSGIDVDLEELLRLSEAGGASAQAFAPQRVLPAGAGTPAAGCAEQAVPPPTGDVSPFDCTAYDSTMSVSAELDGELLQWLEMLTETPAQERHAANQAAASVSPRPTLQHRAAARSASDQPIASAHRAASTSTQRSQARALPTLGPRAPRAPSGPAAPKMVARSEVQAWTAGEYVRLGFKRTLTPQGLSVRPQLGCLLVAPYIRAPTMLARICVHGLRARRRCRRGHVSRCAAVPLHISGVATMMISFHIAGSAHAGISIAFRRSGCQHHARSIRRVPSCRLRDFQFAPSHPQCLGQHGANSGGQF